MVKKFYFNTGLPGKSQNAIEVYAEYDKRSGGYGVMFSVGDRSTPGMFGWVIGPEYFKWYQKRQFKLLLPCGRRSAAKEKEAADLLEKNVLDMVREFAAGVLADGGPEMVITEAA